MVVAAFTGNYVGIVIGLPISGILAASWGWESVFYVFGIVGCVWTVFWLLLVRKSPGCDPFITESEKQYIESSLNTQTKDKAVPIPWKAIWTSSAVWAIIAAQFSEGWGFFTLQTQLPQFFRDVLQFVRKSTTLYNLNNKNFFSNSFQDIAKSGIVSAIPYISMCFMLQVAGFLADWVSLVTI